MLCASAKPPALFCVAGGLAGAGGQFNKDSILSDLSDLIPRDADIVLSCESRKKAVSGDKYCRDPSVAQIYFKICDVSEARCVAYVYNYLAGKTVCVAGHRISSVFCVCINYIRAI